MGGVGPAVRSATPGRFPVLRSTQREPLPDAPDALAYWGRPDGLTRMLRAYFVVAAHCACGLVRIRWTGDCPTIVLVWPPVPLIVMGEPTFEQGVDRRAIGVTVEGGLLVFPAARPRLVLALTRGPAGLEASVDLVDYQPRWGTRALVRWLYGHTQAIVHAWVGRRYLRQFRRVWDGAQLNRETT